MTEEQRTELLKRLDALTDADQEHSHSEADDILCDALLLCGEVQIAEAWRAARRRIGFWYA